MHKKDANLYLALLSCYLYCMIPFPKLLDVTVLCWLESQPVLLFSPVSEEEGEDFLNGSPTKHAFSWEWILL